MSTDQGDRLKTAFESMRDFVNEIRLTFKKDGMELLGQDKGHVVLVRYMLPAKKIRDTGGSYEHNAADTVEVGLRTKLVANVLKCSSPGDTVSLSVDPSIPDRLVFTCQNGAKVSRWEIVTPSVADDDLDSEETVERLHYSGSVTMSSALFHDMIRDLSTADALTVKMCCDGTRLVLSSEGLMTRVSFEVVDCRGGVQQKTAATFSRNNDGAWPVCESHGITFLQRIAKAKNICSRMTIHMKPDFPTAFVYDSPIGTLTYIVAPRDEEDLGGVSTAAAKTPTAMPGPIAAPQSFGLQKKKRARPLSPELAKEKEDPSDDETVAQKKRSRRNVVVTTTESDDDAELSEYV